MNSSLRRVRRGKPRLYRCADTKHLQARLDPGSGVEKVAQRVADKIEGQYREHHCHRREEHEMRRIEEVRARVV